MKINELLSEQQDLDEGLGSMIGKGVGALAKGAGAVVGGAVGAWDAAKKGYAAGKSTVAGDDEAPATPSTAPAAAPASGTALPSTGDTGRPYVAPPAADSGAIGSIMQAVDKLDPASKKQLAGELEKSLDAPSAAEPETPAPGTPPAEPQGSTYDPAKAAADKLAKGQADQQLAQQQMAATQQANAATSQQDAAIKAAADAAKAKSGFQQTAADKLAIKQAADRGIKEAEEKKKKLKKKKIVAEFKSNFLGIKI